MEREPGYMDQAGHVVDVVLDERGAPERIVFGDDDQGAICIARVLDHWQSAYERANWLVATEKTDALADGIYLLEQFLSAEWRIYGWQELAQ